MNTKQRKAGEIVLSEVYDSGAISSCRMNNDEFIITDENSNNFFHMPIGTTTQSSVKARMHPNLR